MAQSWLIGTLVEQGVRKYFKENARAVFEGTVTLTTVVTAVDAYLKGYGYTMTPFNRGVAYDLIRLLGPTCEQDECWLEAWGGPKALDTFCDELEQEELRERADIDELETAV